MSDPDGLTTIYAYDALNRVISVTAPGGVTEYEWFKDSRLQKVTYPNTTSARHTYDAAGRTDTIENRQGVAAVVSSYGYSYDQNGNRTEQIETNGGAAETTTYEYDEADRLLSVEYPDRTVTYTYDDVGNRRSETIVAGSTTLSDRTYAYDERNRLESITDSADPAFDTTFVYDPNGNQASKTRDGTTTSFLYDTRDRIVEIQEDATTLETYLYDYQGLRVRKSGSGGIVRYVYDDQSVLVETTDGGTTVSKYEYGPDRLLSLDNSTEGRQYYLQDALRSVVTLTRPDGGIQARYKYDAWGNLRDEVGSSANRFGFTGHEHDEETGLIYAKARYYDPEIGLFLTEDPFQGEPLTPPSLHRYLYAFQNPTIWRDPTGQGNEEVDGVLDAEDSVLLGPDDPLPEGYQIVEVKNGFRIAYRRVVPGEDGDDRDVVQKATDAVKEQLNVGKSAAKTGEEAAELSADVMRLGNTTDKGLQRDRTVSIQSHGNNSRLGQGKGYEEVQESSEKAGAVVNQAGQVARQALDTVEKAGLGTAAAGGVRKKGLKKATSGKRDDVADDAAEAGVSRGTGSFGGVTGATDAERSFLNNVRSSFSGDSVFTSATRHRGNIVIQRSDIPLSIQNLRRMQSGNSPFVKNAAGEWETLNLHHIGRQDGKMIEVFSSHNTYNPATGGPLHIPGPGGPVRQSGLAQSYWQQRFENFISSGQVSDDLLRQLDR
ncbi:MAG: hypothetical protein MPN21_28050 [Thermoanaerobaculia bacterium]|nr:hypothetical protein [Thermoanaerobaculia bacterium]